MKLPCPMMSPDELLATFRLKLNDKVQDVVASKRLVNSAATLVAQESDLQMERMMRAMDQSLPSPPKKSVGAQPDASPDAEHPGAEARVNQ